MDDYEIRDMIKQNLEIRMSTEYEGDNCNSVVCELVWKGEVFSRDYVVVSN